MKGRSLDQLLHIHYVEPPIEFEANLAKVADFLEPEGGMEPDAGFVGGIDDGDDGVKASCLGAFDERREEKFSNPFAANVCRHINGILRGEALAHPGVIGI